MAVTLAKYTFGSWMRKGISTNINQTDNLGSGTSTVVERATVGVDITVNSRPLHKDFSLLGPGDIIGINPHLVVRTEPPDRVTDFEPNYLPFIEFYDEDFAWRYTPARPSGDKLRPWVVLIVLESPDNDFIGEFQTDDRKTPLPTVKVTDVLSLPPAQETWAWAHVHTNDGHESDSAFEAFLQSLHNLNEPNADKIICRLMCPRRLKPATAYTAFVVPAFETGRLAGLGESIENVDAQQGSWSDNSEAVLFPYYHRWSFRTGENDDFESLIKLLEPREMDSRVGIRDMDGSKPGFGLNVGTNIGSGAAKNVIGLEGALRIPTGENPKISRPQSLNTTLPFFLQLEKTLNMSADLQAAADGESDPVVGPPIYGEHHANEHRLVIGSKGWLHVLNKDPRLRVPAGFGGNVIRENQEKYVARAWEQVEKVIEMNKKIVFAAFSMTAASVLNANFASNLSPAKMVAFFSPLLKKVMGSPVTLHHQMQQDRLPVTAVSPAFRRLVRPRGQFFKRMQRADAGITFERLLHDLNKKGGISPAPPKPTPGGLTTLKDLTAGWPAISFGALPDWMIENRLLLLVLLLLLALLIGFLAGLWLLAVAVAAVAVISHIFLGRLAARPDPVKTMNDPAELARVIREAGPQPGFRFTETNPVVTPDAAGAETSISVETVTTSTEAGPLSFNTVTYHTPAGAGRDSLEAKNFREAAWKLNTRLAIGPTPEAEKMSFDFTNASAKLAEAVNPSYVYPKQLARMITIQSDPGWLLEPEHLVPAMAYPDFEYPMYEKLRDISSELLIPNIGLIPANTISLLATNPDFIEAYMVGLNHEFGRELLWREYPTDQRGSYFRQFWDVRGMVKTPPGSSSEELARIAETYKDIKPLDQWGGTSALGEHANRDIHRSRQMVLVIRGDLLKKYSNVLIYAQKARVAKDKNGHRRPDREPEITEIQTPADMKKEIKFPIFGARVNPDLRFFGFDLTANEARNAVEPLNPDDAPGYYFVIQQMPGDPRFGMDINFARNKSHAITWDDMAWTKYHNNGEPVTFIKTGQKPDADFIPQGEGESREQWGSSSAEMAYILYQKPVMIAIHAREMLKDL